MTSSNAGAGKSERSALDLIQRYRTDFARENGGIPTAHAGPMWHIIVLGHLIIRDLEAMLAGTDLSPADLFVLAVLLLDRDREMRPTDVARMLSVSQAAVSLRLGKLEANGFLLRKSDGADRRVVRLHVTGKGAAITSAMLGQVGAESLFAHSLGKLDQDNREHLEETLAKLSESMSRHFHG